MKSPAPWKLWANPIIRRYARARLRPHALGVALILTLMVAGFISSMPNAFLCCR